MIANDFYTPEVQGDYQLHGIGDFELEEGGSIPDLQLAVATYGTLDEARDNAILVPTWFSGTHETWELVYIGSGRALAMMPGSELRVLHTVAGHFGLFEFQPTYLVEVDSHLGELLATPVEGQR